MASRKKKDYTKLFDLMECGLCKSELCDPRRIECGHVFCLKCLVKQVSNVSECPTCKRPMNPLSGKVDTYPVAKEIASLLQTVASCNNILDEADVNNAKDEDQYDMVDAEEDQSMSFPDSKDVCDLHGYQLVSVCLSCDSKLICAKCSIHSSHDKIEISKQSNYLEQFLNKTHDKLRKRGKDDRTMEEKLQDMIERHIAEKESIKNEIENIAEEMHANIHWKKEETLHPIENKADDFVKLLTERQERIKDRLLEFTHISEKIGKLSNDGTADFFRKAQRLVKQANIALKEESTSLPEYQTIVFTKNKAVVEDLSDVQLGDIKFQSLQAEEESSDFTGFNMSSSRSPTSFGRSDWEKEEKDAGAKPKRKETKGFCEDSRPSQSLGPHDPNMNSLNHVYINDVIQIGPDDSPPIPPRNYNQMTSTANEANETYDMAESTYLSVLSGDRKSPQPSLNGEKFNTKKSGELATAATAAARPPPLSPFSGSFRKSVSIATDHRVYPQRFIHRVFLPFRFSGFTVFRRNKGKSMYYAFITEAHVKIFRDNGELYQMITDLTNPFDVASKQHGNDLAPLYVTDEGKKIGDGSVKVYSSDGKFMKVLVGKLRKPQGIAVSRVGLLYVCDEANILVLCPDSGKKKRVISSIGKDPLFALPLYVMVSATGKILVSDVGTRQLKIHDEARKHTDKFLPSEKAEDIYAHFCPGMCSEDSSSNYYVVDQERNSLYMLVGGGRSQKMELPDKPKGHDGIPTAVAFDADTGNIIVF